MQAENNNICWPFEVRPLTQNLGAEIIGVDLVRGVDDELFVAIYEAFVRYQVLLFGTQELPPGRQVEFARRFGQVQIHVMNQYHAEDRMTEAQRNAVPPVDHPIVRTHPDTGRKCLFLGDHAETIRRMNYEEGRELIEELNALAIHPDLTYRHCWTPGELLV